jgi:hypothetical protein
VLSLVTKRETPQNAMEKKQGKKTNTNINTNKASNYFFLTAPLGPALDCISLILE